MAWTEELKQQVIDAYTGADPTPETSTEIIKDIAEEYEQSPNGVRMVLVQAGVYVKKEATTATTTTKTGTTGGTRVSKEASIAALKAAIKARGKAVDEEILDKLTGKAAVYLTSVISG
jgi:hypothetical protein